MPGEVSNLSSTAENFVRAMNREGITADQHAAVAALMLAEGHTSCVVCDGLDTDCDYDPIIRDLLLNKVMHRAIERGVFPKDFNEVAQIMFEMGIRQTPFERSKWQTFYQKALDKLWAEKDAQDAPNNATPDNSLQ